MKLKVFIIAVAIVFVSCGSDAKKGNETSKPNEEKVEVNDVVVSDDSMQDIGIGPIESMTLSEIDEAMAAEGEVVFKAKCSACHKLSKRFVGPGLAGVTERRSPEWIMNMILNPEEMVEKNPTAKKLLAEYLAPMANQNLTETEARQILEYFRTKKAK
ncbi:MAG: cytochrome c [Lutibacter sp.]|uniref:c-type cytochrome n=1 Tax=Lutibacter sp. TaxID=1925666 RepID=UPI0017FFA956|nr:cytochrome c [Lutibacter sp.]MBT8316754.1 cytochrome c [Lutibacter sp.]NNJ57614.1 cytochrome c [Lutibacter sp.]